MRAAYMLKLSWKGEGVPSREEQIQLANEVGERVREARLMQGYSQLRAAELMGYANSTKLAKIEGGGNTSQIPMWFLRRCAAIYHISIDYLMLGIEDPAAKYKTAGNGLLVLMQNQWHDLRKREIAVIDAAEREADKLEALLISMVNDLREARKTIQRIDQLNPEWQEIRGGIRLESSLDTAARIGTGIAIGMRKAGRRAAAEAEWGDLEPLQGDLE